MMINENLVTKEQLLLILKAWGANPAAPRKGKMDFVVWPGDEHAEITYTNKVSTYGKRLYSIKFVKHMKGNRPC